MTMSKGSRDRVAKRDQFRKNHEEVYSKNHTRVRRPGKTVYTVDEKGEVTPKVDRYWIMPLVGDAALAMDKADGEDVTSFAEYAQGRIVRSLSLYSRTSEEVRKQLKG
jgi:hypothetical protein